MSSMMLNIDASLAERLQQQANLHGVFVEMEINTILQAALPPSTNTADWLNSIRAKVAPFNGIGLCCTNRRKVELF